MAFSTRKYCVCALVSIVAVLAYFLPQSLRRHANRHGAVGGYGEAIGQFYIRAAPLPTSLEELESTYNAYDRRRVELPSPPWFLRPTYRPVGGLRGGPYLLIVETKPPGLNLPDRLVIYANADGSGVEVKLVWEWELATRIASDDELRVANKTRSSP